MHFSPQPRHNHENLYKEKIDYPNVHINYKTSLFHPMPICIVSSPLREPSAFMCVCHFYRFILVATMPVVDLTIVL